MHTKLWAVLALLAATSGFAQVPVNQIPEIKKFEIAPHLKKTAEKNTKLSSVLANLQQNFTANKTTAKRDAERQGLLFKDGDKVLVEVRTVRENNRKAGQAMSEKGFEIRNNNVPGLYEGWVSIKQLEEMTKDNDVLFIRQARRVDLTIGNSDSQGINESMANTWHATGLDGTGVTIANIDGGYQGWAARQATNDWPPNAQLTNYNVNGGAFGTDTPHGTATLEINYDMAPDADFQAYETTTVGDWYNALGDAVTNGADIVSVSLGAPIDGVGDGSDCPPGVATPCGTIAEASTDARNAGVLVVNAAGNERESHWGGLYNDLAAAPGNHDWGTANNVNGSVFCIPAGQFHIVSMYWDDWTNVDHDYDLILVELNDAAAAWQLAAASGDPQTGLAGQEPTEILGYTVPALGNGTFCPVGTTGLGVVVARNTAATNRNLQVFASFDLSTNVPARSLGFPADSPSVMTVAAVDVTSLAQESYSSEGPVLGPGGSLAASTIDKPNIAAYANVDTEAYGAGIFNGTSAATPHVAGAAALVLEAFPSYAGNPDALQGFLETCALDLGPAGWDTQFGHGELNLCDGTFDAWTRDNNMDNGVEPHSMSNIWHSPDIKICQTQNCPSSVQPEFGQTNWVYVTLRNTGPGATAPIVPAAGTLELYYSNMGGASQWPTDWTLIDTVDVTLDGGEVRDIEVEWTNVPAVGHYCMLSRWVSVDDPLAVAEIAQTTTNVRNNNNLSWKNFNVVDLLANISGNSNYALRNIEKEFREIEFELRFLNDNDRLFLAGGGLVDVILPEKLAERFREGGKLINVEQVDDLTLRLAGNRGTIILPLGPQETADLELAFTAREPFERKGKLVQFNFEAVQVERGEDVGGVTFQINARGMDTDTDQDGIPDFTDRDDDNDNVEDFLDQNPLDRKVGKFANKTIQIDLQRGSQDLRGHNDVVLLRDSGNGHLAFELNADPAEFEAAYVELTYAGESKGVSMEVRGNSGQDVIALVEQGVVRPHGVKPAVDRSMKNGLPSPKAGEMVTMTIGNGTMTVKTPGNTTTHQDAKLFDLEQNGGKLIFSINGTLNGLEGSGVTEAKVVLIPKQQ